MNNSYYYIPPELLAAFNEIATDRSPYHETFKHWWNRGIDAIRQDNFATETKRILSGMAEIKILTDDLKQYVSTQLDTVQEKKEAFVSDIRDEAGGESPYKELQAIWDTPVSFTEAISRSVKELEQYSPESANENFTTEELLYHKITGIQKAFDGIQRLYAKYLGLAGCRSFYWEHDQLCYFNEARGTVPLVSWSGIQNRSLKELISDGHRQDHATYIRYRYYKQEKELTMREAYDKVWEELERLRPNVTYSLPESVRSLNKSAKKHIQSLLKTQSR
jgi:hypothetical protein